MLLLVRLGFVLLVSLTCSTTAMALGESSLSLDLYTIGKGREVFESFGHTVICAREGSEENGRCFDFGITDESSVARIVWGALTGKPQFFPVRVDEKAVLSAFQGADRTIWRQRLNFDPPVTERIVRELDAAAEQKLRYAYHPYHHNCTTMIRDIIDRALGGALERNSEHPSTGATYRDLMEQGLSGRFTELAALTLVIGPESDRIPSSFEGLAVPTRLRDELERRLGSAPELVYRQQGFALNTSPSVGRTGLVGLGLLLAILLAASRKRSQGSFRVALSAVGATLLACALIVFGVALATSMPELSRNWALLLLLPTDALLLILYGEKLERYIRVRTIGLIATVALALVLGVKQPILPIAALPLLPLSVALLSLRTGRVKEPAS